MPELRKLSVNDGMDVYQMLQDIPLDENGLQNKVNGHCLTDALRKAGGHIGYGIAPQYRGKGYGKELLRLLIGEAYHRGIDKVLVTIHLDNKASQAVALANGGVITERTDERVLVWIDTKQA